MKKLVVLFLLIFSGSAWAGAYGYPIMQGSTSETVSHFTVVAPASESLNFSIETPDRVEAPHLSVARVAYQGSDYAVYRLRAENLRPGVDYGLVVESRGVRADRRVFQSLNTQKLGGRVAFGSCMVRQLHNPYLWRQMASDLYRPDVFFLIGDAVYLDRENLLFARMPKNGLEIWNRFVEARLKEELYKWDRLIPIFSLWDDHDSVGDNADATLPLMEEGRKIYETFFANDAIPGFLNHGPGQAKQFRLFQKNYVFLDGRSFRNLSSMDPLFGREQNQFLAQSLQAGPNFIVSGDQFYGKFLKKDSLEYDYPEYAVHWTNSLRVAAEQIGATLAFLSGDIHFSEVQDLEPSLFGYPTVEVTSSNLHSFGLPGHYVLKPDNPRRRIATGTHNFVLLDFDNSSNLSFTFRIRSIGWRGQELFNTVANIQPVRSIEMANARKSDCEDLLYP